MYAALDVKTGQVHGMTAGRPTSKDFITFLEGLVARADWAKEIHVVLDHLSAHKTRDVERFLAEHPRVSFHFTPTYSSWLNQVELWFAKIQRDVIRRGVFTSLADLGNKLRKYIRAYSKSAKPFRWNYTDSTRRIYTNKIAGTAYLAACRSDFVSTAQPLPLVTAQYRPRFAEPREGAVLTFWLRQATSTVSVTALEKSRYLS